MTRARFLAVRRPAWEAFEELLERVEQRRTSRLSGRDVSEFARLYRAVCYDLATVRSREWGRGLEDHLNDLVRRGHSSLYRSPPGRPQEVVRFFAEGFPRLLRSNRAYFWVAAALFLVPGLIAALVVAGDPEKAARILPGVVREMFREMYSGSPEAGPGGGAGAAMTGFYVYNNVGIAFRCFATGILFGAGTVVLLIYNSIYIGAAAGYVAGVGHGERFFSFVIAHGAFELTAIAVSGAAGLVLGHALVHPGARSRLESLRRRGLVAVQLAGGAGGMLAVAALIEAFWSPCGAPSGLKFAVGALLWIAVIAYLGWAGRERSAR
ncbi:MAG: stage II sporulation protein M [Planctomycetes bacterium]|nr:stage II sporulation protein M [Planctomycetota bacterium]